MSVGTLVVGPVSDAAWKVRKCLPARVVGGTARYGLLLERVESSVNDGKPRKTKSGWWALMPLIELATGERR